MPNVGTASVDLEVDRQKLGRSITDAVDKVKKPVRDKMTSLGKTMSLAVTAPVIAGFAAATKAASDLSESVNKTDVVFGKSAKAIHDFSKTAAKDLGQSKRQAEEAAGTFGNLFVSMKIGQKPAADMSVTLVKLASDLASFNNASPQEALDALRAGLVGETEPLRRFGINLNDAALREKALSLGLVKTTKEVLPPAARAQAAYALVMEQSTTAQGDFARTADGMANKTRIAKAQLEDTAATIGAKVLPIALKLVNVGSGILQFFTSLPADVQNIALAGIAMVAAVGPIAGLAGNAMKAVHGLKAAFDALTIGAHAASLSLAGGFGLALLGIGVLAVGVASAKRTLGDINTTINEGTAPAVNKFALAARLAGEESKNMQVEAYMAAVSMGKLRESTGFSESLDKEVKAASKLLGELSGSANISAERIVQLANSMRINLGTATDEQKDKLAAAIAEISRGVTPTERLASVTETLGNAAATTAESFDAFKEAVDAALGVQLNADEAAVRYQQKIAALSTAITENGTKTGAATEKQQNLTLALIDVVQGAQGEVDALARSGRISADAATQKQELINRLDALKAKFPQLAGPIDTYIANLGNIPASVSTTVTTPGLESAIRGFETMQRVIGMLTGVKIPVPSAAQLGGQREHGGPVSPHLSYLVGEKRPEKFKDIYGNTSVVGWGGPHIFSPSAPGRIIPTLHSGGTVPGAAGQEVLTLLEAGETVLPAGSGDGVPLHNYLMIDGKVFAEVASKALREREMAKS